jgi:ornithine cyclodeaminase/alanine dehydrogenase-like protein (mu-crystallin family)
MELVLLSQSEVSALLPMAECMEVVADALRALTEGEAILPLRTVIKVPDTLNAFGSMPAYLRRPGALGIKVISVFPDNSKFDLGSHQGAVLLFEVDHGQLIAIMDARAITAIRTAAVSGIATRALAREDASELAILGAGEQALTHLDAMCLARPIRRVRVWSRSDERTRRFARIASERSDTEVEAVPSAREAVRGAAIVCTVTASRDPVLRGEWLDSGTHINAVGASLPIARELDSEAVRRAKLFVDRRESAISEAGDFLIPKREGIITESHIMGELGELLLGRIPGRRSADEITLFKSLGLAIEDVAAAQHVYAQAVRGGVGTRVELGR